MSCVTVCLDCHRFKAGQRIFNGGQVLLGPLYIAFNMSNLVSCDPVTDLGWAIY